MPDGRRTTTRIIRGKFLPTAHRPTAPAKEATARIKINQLLDAAGWRFFADKRGIANIQLEPKVTLTTQALGALGENFEKASKGFIDFLLLNEKGFPFVVLEAKAEDKNPLVGKEQARKYAKSNTESRFNPKRTNRFPRFQRVTRILKTTTI